MMTRRCTAAVAVWLAFGALAVAAPTDPAKAFDTQYGSRVAAAAASPQAADDLALADELLAAAGSTGTHPALLPPLCRNAYDLSSKHTKGFRTAISAMTLLAKTVPEQKNACEEKTLDLYQNRYAKSRGAVKTKAGGVLVATLVRFADGRAAAGDFAGAARLYRRAMPLATNLRDVDRFELQTRLNHAVTRQGFRTQAQRLKADLRSDPANQTIRDELVRIYVVELNDPDTASKQLDLKADDVAAKYVLLAGMSVERLPARALVELGRWYQNLAAKSSTQGRLTSLVRAKTYYERYLETNAAASADRDDVAAHLQDVDNVLARIATVAPKVIVLSDPEFNARYATNLPRSANVGAGGKGFASSHWGGRLPQNVFDGARTGVVWSLNGPQGWFLAKWEPPVHGRHILVITRDGKRGTDAWGNATVAINGNRPIRVDGMSSGTTLILDLGLVVPITTVRFTINGTMYPGLAAIEVHAEAPPAAAPQSLTSPAAPVE